MAVVLCCLAKRDPDQSGRHIFLRLALNTTMIDVVATWDIFSMMTQPQQVYATV